MKLLLETRYHLPLLYALVALPTLVILCFTIPPMQARDEGRHFLRAFQISAGHLLSQLNPATGEAGGFVPKAEADFVRDKMTTDFLRQQDQLPTRLARLTALDRSSAFQAAASVQTFAAFPGATIYPPALYLPQILSIRLSRFFTDKVYILFYFARLCNALFALTLIFLALCLAPTHQHLLLIPAVLPTSFYQIASLSSDASIIALSILFVALCLRFEQHEGPALRAGLVLSLLLLTLGKPVHIPAILLLLPAYKRLGWRRTILFCSQTTILCLASYLLWGYLAHSFITQPVPDTPGNPIVQLQALLTAPNEFLILSRTTLEHQGWPMVGDIVGILGWFALPLPKVVYLAGILLGVTVIGYLALHSRKLELSRVLCGLSASLGSLIAVCLAAYLLWTPPGSPQLVGLQGRYFLLAIMCFLFLAPPATRLPQPSRVFLSSLAIAWLLFSSYSSVEAADHYYLRSSKLLGQNIHKLYARNLSATCPAAVSDLNQSWFALVETGTLTSPATSARVVLTNVDGTILGESDPALIGSDPADWRAFLWIPDQEQQITSWLLSPSAACAFNTIDLRPHKIPAT